MTSVPALSLKLVVRRHAEPRIFELGWIFELRCDEPHEVTSQQARRWDGTTTRPTDGGVGQGQAGIQIMLRVRPHSSE